MGRVRLGPGRFGRLSFLVGGASCVAYKAVREVLEPAGQEAIADGFGKEEVLGTGFTDGVPD